QLAKQHRHKLIPAAKAFRSSLRLMLSHRSRKGPPIDQRKQLRKAAHYRYHKSTSDLSVMPPLPRRFCFSVLTTLLQVGVLFRCCLGQVWVDLIFTSGDAAIHAAYNASDKMPIVFTQVGDSVIPRLPQIGHNIGGKITGISSLNVRLAPKRL